MINLILALILIMGLVWVAKRFYFPTEVAQYPEKYPIQAGTKVSKKELTVVLANLQRWRKEGKISREEYDHLIDICLHEIQQL